MQIRPGIYTLVIFCVVVGFSDFAWSMPKGNVKTIPRILNGNEVYKGGKVLGLFIGIQEYNDPYWADLKYPQKDVQDMVSFFTESSSLKLDDKIVVVDPKETTCEIIYRYKLKEFQLKNASPNDVVIVYISSHGTVLIDPDASTERDGLKLIPYILTSDSVETNLKETAIRLDCLTNWFDNLKSQRKVLILDMCHSPHEGKSQIAPKESELIFSAKGISYQPIEDSEASIILSACPIGRTSFEDAKLENGVYTHFLIEGMKSGDLNMDGAVTISEAHNYAIDRTRQYTFTAKSYKQIPVANSKILGKDPIIVFGKPERSCSPTLFSFSSLSKGVEIFIDNTSKGIFPKGILVPPGEHKIEFKRNNKILFKDTISFKKGYEYNYDPLMNVYGSNFYIFGEFSYREYSRDGVSGKLLAGIATNGISIHCYNIFKKWFGVSTSFDFGQNEEIKQTAFRAGPKFLFKKGPALLSVGPDFMFLNFQYENEKIDGKIVDQEMSFFCPGIDALFIYRLQNKFLFMAGIRENYMPYEINTDKYDIFLTQVYISIGYNF